MTRYEEFGIDIKILMEAIEKFEHENEFYSIILRDLIEWLKEEVEE